ncbi:MAG TPA: hypothetical protein PKA49_10205 [Tepidiformaceae bacterium]|nr:hypothetical protein [Thermoflexaceae bacterium]HMS59211.1 hypothetical protein [Tepidiformaceae bacterium]
MIDFERESRTPHSEAYMLLEDGGIIGRVDIHYQGANVHATLCTTADANEERIQELIDAIDERLVMTADPYREDFIVSVWRGSPAGVYSDSDTDDDDDDNTFNLGDLGRN